MKGLERADFNVDYRHLEKMMSRQRIGEESLAAGISRKGWHVDWNWVRRWAQETGAKAQVRKSSK